MKQYVYRIFLMLGLALWLVSCTGTETPIDDLGNIPEESIPSGTGNMFRWQENTFANDYMGTKAYEGVDRGSISEILIDGVRMVLYEGGVVKYCLDLDIQVQPITMILKLPEVISIIGPLMGTESSFRQ